MKAKRIVTVYLQGNNHLKEVLRREGVKRSLGTWYRYIQISYRPGVNECKVIVTDNCKTTTVDYRLLADEMRACWKRQVSKGFFRVDHGRSTFILWRLDIIAPGHEGNRFGDYEYFAAL